jgi:type II secretory pathway component GspD/PulD (secretin)
MMNRIQKQVWGLMICTSLSGCINQASLKQHIEEAPSAMSQAELQPSLSQRLQAEVSPEQAAMYRLNRQQLSLEQKQQPAAVPERPRAQCVPHPRGMKTNHIRKLDLAFFEMPLRDALVEVSVMSGVPVVIGENVDGLITVNMSGVSFDDALEVMLSGGDISFRKMERHILVGNARPDSPVFHKLAISCHYRPRHTKPTDLAVSLTPYFQQFISLHNDADYLTITATPDTLRKIRSHLDNYDRKPRQLLLEMHIVEVSSDAMELLGVDWNRYGRDPNTSMLRRLGTAEWNGYKPESDPSVSSLLTLGALPMRTLSDSLNFLRTQGEAQVKAMPSIVTLDGKEAVFSSMNTVWLPFKSAGDTGRRRELTYGVHMKVVPRIAAGGQVKLEIVDASVSDFTESDQGIPRIISHSISNTVHVRDGDYLILGGLLQKKSRRDGEGVPGLKDAPVVGNLFGQKQQFLQETEVLIMIRPKVLGS